MLGARPLKAPSRKTQTRWQREAKWATLAPRGTDASQPTPGRGGGCTAWIKRLTSWGASSLPWKTRESCPSTTLSRWRRFTSLSCRSCWPVWFIMSPVVHFQGKSRNPPGGTWFTPCGVQPRRRQENSWSHAPPSATSSFSELHLTPRQPSLPTAVMANLPTSVTRRKISSDGSNRNKCQD